MDNNTLIINEKYLKKYSLLPLNYQMNEVMPFVTMAQEIWLRPVLGTAFYEELLDQVGNNNLTDENATLLVQAAWPYLSTSFDMEFLPFAYLHISEVGVTKGHSDNSDSADLKDITFLQSQIRKNLETRKDYLISYLRQHESSFPLWAPDELNCSCNKIDTCCGEPHLNDPNKMNIVYTTKRVNTDLK